MPVAPFVGAWIEISKTKADIGNFLSLRSSERGLKLKSVLNKSQKVSRSVRRSVD